MSVLLHRVWVVWFNHVFGPSAQMQYLNRRIAERVQ